ncbi:SpoIIE family protein phosphatase [Streptomyces sp. NPDC047079]|uniref:SpoIIE family protein phosphatase n=1 Tax=Streptomyces sp. NPDC047079 TaxID=3154607 RepID=UPI003406811F
MSLALFTAVSRLVPRPMLVCTASGQVLAVNPAATRAAASLRPGANLLDLSQSAAELNTCLRQWLRTGHPLPGALTVPGEDGKPVRFRSHGARAAWWTGPEPVVQLHLSRLDHGDRFVALSEQVRLRDQQMAYRRAITAQQERLLAQEKAARERMQRLYRLTAALAASVTVGEVCEAVYKTAPQALNAHTIVLELHSSRIVPLLEPAAAAGSTVPGPAVPLEGAPLAASTSIDLDAPDTAPVQAPQENAARVPLEAEGVVLGYLTAHHEPDTVPDDKHTTAVAQQIAQAVRRAGLFEHEHRLAERLQRSLLPALPHVPGLDIAGGYAPGSHLVDVGGDWYDVHLLDADTVAFTIGDVAGHGIAQATTMAQITTVLRSIARRCGHNPPQVLEELNDFLATYHDGLMATACYATYHRPTRTLRYARAGHPPSLLLHPDGSGRYLDQALAPPLGPVRHVRYRQQEVTVPTGAALVLYTDGLVERRGEAIDEGLARLRQLAEATPGLTAGEICGLLLHEQPDAEFPDDRALLVARFPEDRMAS